MKWVRVAASGVSVRCAAFTQCLVPSENKDRTCLSVDFIESY